MKQISLSLILMLITASKRIPSFSCRFFGLWVSRHLFNLWNQHVMTRSMGWLFWFIILWFLSHFLFVWSLNSKNRESWLCRDTEKPKLFLKGRDTSSFLVWITLGLSWVLPLVLGLGAWVFSLHLQARYSDYYPIDTVEISFLLLSIILSFLSL